MSASPAMYFFTGIALLISNGQSDTTSGSALWFRTGESDGKKDAPLSYDFGKHCRKSEIKQGASGRPGHKGIATDNRSWNISDSDVEDES